jgi:hypothetical protein
VTFSGNLGTFRLLSWKDQSMDRRGFLSSLVLCLLLVPVSGQQPRPAPSPTPQEATIEPEQKPPSIDEQDVVGKEKSRVVTQWVDVEVVK